MKSKYHIIMNVIPKYIIKYLIKYQRSIVTIHDKIYDLTNFKQQHPGGSDVICEYNGLDATSIFDGATHSTIAIEYSRNFLLFSNQHYFYQSYSYKKKYDYLIEKLYTTSILTIKKLVQVDNSI
jgi:hypothetical protein